MTYKSFVSSIKKRGVGFEIEISTPLPFFLFFHKTNKENYFCSELGCVNHNKKLVRNQEILNLLSWAYKRAKKKNARI